MFVPSVYREPDHGWAAELMRRNPLALLMTNGTGLEGPSATHVPIITDQRRATDSDDVDELDGPSVLLGHMNRANPQWQSLRSGTPAVLSFTGPHGYVSPALYERSPAAPTWNFTAVQVRGVVDLIEGEDETLAVVESTARTFEADFGRGWDPTGSIDHFCRILPGVGAFRFSVTSCGAMFKLSQEQSGESRERVCRHFQQQESGRAREAAEYMGRLPGRT